MTRTTTGVVGGLLLLASTASAQATSDTVRTVLELHAIIEARGADIGPRIWPGFRPDTIPTLYVISHRGKLLVQWRHPWPDGFTPIPGRPDAGTAGTQLVSLPSGRFISFMSVDSSMTPGLILGTSIHEAFHSFERSEIREGRRFGSGENAMLVGTYPVFDVENEAAFALEGRTLRRALEEASLSDAATRAGEFLAIRERRQARLDADLVEFERMAEMNEGLAQYALLRGLAEVARLQGGPWVQWAAVERRTELDLLDSLLFVSRRSVRRRFYATGSGIALLLDRLAGSSWKSRLVRENQSLDEALTQALAGYGSAPGQSRAAMEQSLVAPRVEAEASVAGLRTLRRSQADSLLGRPGLKITLDVSLLGEGGLQWCGFDPQNTLQTGDGRTLHMRFVNVCAGRSIGKFDQPAVQDMNGASIATVVDPATLRMRGAGKPLALKEGESAEIDALELEAINLKLTVPRARVSWEPGRLRVRLLPELP